ncbi:MAG: serine/threonine protein kinase [Thermoleophilaceae bacterium]|nr:serine/threonine protein kinase [Thermoleophilaceae bacterium]
MLGRGGMATVYAAQQIEDGRRVALKLLADELSGDPEFVARFRREGRAQAALDHPHVVTVYEAGESEHGLFLAMRLVPGPTLAKLIHERALDSQHSLALLRDVAGALDEAHAQGLVHRDVKPQNVLVGDSDDAYLGDFGLTTVGGADGVTVTGRLVGTISYLAPEVIRGSDAGPASDRYAFAAMAFECLTGTVVFPRRSQAAILFAHTSEPPPRASGRRPELPPALDRVFERALAKAPGDRPESAVGLVDEIAEGLEHAGMAGLGPPPPPGAAALEDETAAPIPVATPGASEHRRRSAAWLVAAVVAVAGVAAALGATLGGDDERAASAAPATLPGVQVLGSDLAGPGQAVGCDGRRPRPRSRGCTIVQSALPGRSLVVPADGVIRRWAVRSARGELALAVVRPRGEDTFQVSRSRNEFVGNDGPHLFETDLAVERGDLVGLVVLSGSAAGVRAGVGGARTRRWIPELPFGRAPERGFPGELLLRAEYVRGGRQRVPDQLGEPEVASVRPGRVVRRVRARFKSGRPVETALVSLGDRFVLDQFLEGRRTARIDVPGFRPGDGRILTFGIYAPPTPADQLDLLIEYVRAESSRIEFHYFATFPREFEFIN